MQICVRTILNPDHRGGGGWVGGGGYSLFSCKIGTASASTVTSKNNRHTSKNKKMRRCIHTLSFCSLIKISMTRKCHNINLQPKPRQRGEESHNTNTHPTQKQQQKGATINNESIKTESPAAEALGSEVDWRGVSRNHPNFVYSTGQNRLVY